MSSDAAVEIRQCVRCQGYVLAGTEGGSPAVADPAPLNVDGYRQALIAGQRTFRLIRSASGKPWKLQADTAVWSSDADRLRAHGCPNAPLAALAPPVAQDPHSAPATPGDGQAGPLRPHARASGRRQGQNHSAATPASPHRSRPYTAARCQTCHQVIGTDPIVGMQQGTYWLFAYHESCAA